MQDSKGLKRILTVSSIYGQFQKLIGETYIKRWLLKNYWQVSDSVKIVDIGCGPGNVIEYLSGNYNYVGFDISPEYITFAEKHHGDRGDFFIGTASELLQKAKNDPSVLEELLDADLVLCNGLLHHLSDNDVTDVFKLAKRIMKDSGRLVCYEPCLLVHQSKIGTWLMGKDRGQNIRTEIEWKKLISTVFLSFDTNIATNLIRLPYTYIIIECGKQVGITE